MRIILTAIIAFIATTHLLARTAVGQATTQPEVQMRGNLQLLQLEGERDSVQAKARQIQDKIHADEEIIRDASGRWEVSPERLRQTIAAWDDQIQAIQVDIQSTDARVDAIAQAVSELKERAETAASHDPVVSLLREVAAVREKGLSHDRELAKTGLMADSDVSQIQAALAEANAQVALQTEKAVAANGGDSIAALNKELIDLHINQAERRARAQILMAQRASLADVRNYVEELEPLSDELKQTQDLLPAITVRLERLEEQLGMHYGSDTKK